MFVLPVPRDTQAFRRFLFGVIWTLGSETVSISPRHIKIIFGCFQPYLALISLSVLALYHSVQWRSQGRSSRAECPIPEKHKLRQNRERNSCKFVKISPFLTVCPQIGKKFLSDKALALSEWPRWLLLLVCAVWLKVAKYDFDVSR